MALLTRPVGPQSRQNSPVSAPRDSSMSAAPARRAPRRGRRFAERAQCHLCASDNTTMEAPTCRSDSFSCRMSGQRLSSPQSFFQQHCMTSAAFATSGLNLSARAASKLLTLSTAEPLKSNALQISFHHIARYRKTNFRVHSPTTISLHQNPSVALLSNSLP